MIRTVIPFGLFFLAFLHVDLEAQQSVVRDGFWMGAGFGAGWVRVGCSVCAGDRKGGMSAQARMGSTLSQHLLMGVEANGWRKSEEVVTSNLGSLHAVAYWYPQPRANAYFLKGGIGVVAYKADDTGDGDEEPFTSTSFGAQIGVGYDLRIARNISLTPYFNLTGSLFADLHQGNNRIADIGLTLIQFGAGITWH